MVQAYHAVFCAYGFWLPNDPRGSWSDFVRTWELRLFGPATKVTTRRSVAASPHDRELREVAKMALRFPAVNFNGYQALSIAREFATASTLSEYRVLACSILPGHVHIVVARHERPIEKIVAHLKAEATRQLNAEGCHPLLGYTESPGRAPSPWARKCWKVFLNNNDDIRRAIRYVQENPAKEGKRRQEWPFVTSFEGSPRRASPPAKRFTGDACVARIRFATRRS